MFVGDVVGQLELVEADHFLHPLLSGGRAVGVDVHALRHLWVRLARNDPAAVVELVPQVVSRDNIQQQDIL